MLQIPWRLSLVKHYFCAFESHFELVRIFFFNKLKFVEILKAFFSTEIIRAIRCWEYEISVLAFNHNFPNFHQLLVAFEKYTKFYWLPRFHSSYTIQQLTKLIKYFQPIGQRNGTSLHRNYYSDSHLYSFPKFYNSLNNHILITIFSMNDSKNIVLWIVCIYLW